MKSKEGQEERCSPVKEGKKSLNLNSKLYHLEPLAETRAGEKPARACLEALEKPENKMS